MTNSGLPAGVAEVGQALARSAGYLRNTLRESRQTCEVCSCPVDGYDVCYPCLQQQRSGEPIADRVASVVYAVRATSGQDDQTYIAVAGYKAPRPQQGYIDVVNSLLVLGVGHVQCDFRLSGARGWLWATVPSTRNPEREHPFHALVASRFGGTQQEARVRTVAGARKERDLQPANFTIESPIPNGTHVSLFDDSWVTGGSAQSVAIALRRAGAASVSILTVARVLNRGFGSNAEFIRDKLAPAFFDPTLCPWTGNRCP